MRCPRFPHTPLTSSVPSRVQGLRWGRSASGKFLPRRGSSFAGDGENAIRDLASAMKEVFGKEQ